MARRKRKSTQTQIIHAAALRPCAGPASAMLVGSAPRGSESRARLVPCGRLDDYAWWLDAKGDPAVANATLRGEVIGKAMATQVALVRRQEPEAEFIACAAPPPGLGWQEHASRPRACLRRG